MQWWERNSEVDPALADEAYLVSGIFSVSDGHTGARDMHWLTWDRMEVDLSTDEIARPIHQYICHLAFG